MPARASHAQWLSLCGGGVGCLQGEHGFDPLGFIKGFKLDQPEKMMVMKTKEINNGRLAMIAWVGMYAQLQVTGHIWPLI